LEELSKRELPMKLTPIISEEKIQNKVSEIADKISRDYQGKNPVLVTILRGGFVLAADLIRKLDIDCEIDFLATSSYGSGKSHSGVVRLLKDLDTLTENRHILLIEDIIDTGITLKYIIELLKTRNPASLEIVALLVKDIPGIKGRPTPKYMGFKVPNRFIVGYGLDFNQHYRGLPFIAILE